jgi:hypothetical protein
LTWRSFGNNQSGPANYAAATTHGNRWLQGALGDAAAAAARTKHSYLNAYYQRLIRRRGKKRALVAVMHKIIISVWHMLTINTDYRDLGTDHWAPDAVQIERRCQRLLAELHALTARPASAAPA